MVGSVTSSQPSHTHCLLRLSIYHNNAFDSIPPPPFIIIHAIYIHIYTHTDFSEEPTEATAEEIRRDAQKWVDRSRFMSIVTMTVLVAWVVVAQVFRNDLPAVLFLYSADNAELTGW